MTYSGTGPGVPKTAFGDNDSAQLTPIVQLQFINNVNSYETNTFLTGSGTVTSNQPFAVVQSGAAINSSGSLSSDQSIPYRAGQGNLYIFGVIFATGVTGNVQLAGAGGTVNGLFFGYNGAVFGINRRSNGVDNWIAQNSWNVDPMDGTGTSLMTLNPVLGNLYKIEREWLGFGNINFFLENPSTGLFVLVHRIQYPNSATVPSTLQPTAPLYLSSVNTTNNTNIAVQSPGMVGFVEGLNNQIGNLFSFNNTKSITTIETCIFNLRNNSTFNGVSNFKRIQLLNFSVSTTTRVNKFSLRLNATIGGVPAYTNINATESCASSDTAGTTATGGTLLFTTFVGIGAFIQVDLRPFKIFLVPGDIMTLSSANLAGGGANNIGSLNWLEVF